MTKAISRSARGYAGGGLPTAPWFIRRSATQLGHIGAIASPVAGRTDHIPLNVASGSYVVPADIVSGLGQGNSAAGHQVLGRMFGSMPYGGASSKGKTAPKAKLPNMMTMAKPPTLGLGGLGSSSSKFSFAGGGGANDNNSPNGSLVPIMAAGGEFVLSPDQVMKVGGGDLKKGHETLDTWIKLQRQKHIKTLKNLPGPAKR